jgi:hypothetical protein
MLPAARCTWPGCNIINSPLVFCLTWSSFLQFPSIPNARNRKRWWCASAGDPAARPQRARPPSANQPSSPGAHPLATQPPVPSALDLRLRLSCAARCGRPPPATHRPGLGTHDLRRARLQWRWRSTLRLIFTATAVSEARRPRLLKASDLLQLIQPRYLQIRSIWVEQVIWGADFRARMGGDVILDVLIIGL